MAKYKYNLLIESANQPSEDELMDTISDMMDTYDADRIDLDNVDTSKKITIKKSKNADTRSAEGEVSKEELTANTESHINDVINVGNWIAEKLKEQVQNHDHTKIEYMDEFHQDFQSGKQGAEFKQLPWWQKHMTERHHLNDSVPEDVNLIDVLEMVIDCTVAGLARSGEVYGITIPQEVIEQAIENTKNLIINNVEVEE